MNHDDDATYDAPHAFWAIEGRPCSCPSAYYGGDCAHTTSDEDELTPAPAETFIPAWCDVHGIAHVCAYAGRVVGGSVCPICKGPYRRTYEEHTGSQRHLKALGR